MTDHAHLHPHQHPHHHPFSAQLDEEWDHLRCRRRTIATARSWAAAVDADLADGFHEVTDLADLVAATQRSAAGHGERMLLALVRLASTEQLAGRVIVQRLLPGLIAAAVPYRAWCERVDPVQHAVGSLWISIHDYDHERRCRHVAASLISDAIYKAFRQPARRRSATEEACAPARFDEIASGAGAEPLVEFASTLREARRSGVPTEDVELLRRLVSADSPRRLAAEGEVTMRTIRNRRDRAVRRVRQAVAAAPDRAA